MNKANKSEHSLSAEVYTAIGEKAGSVELPKEVFSARINNDFMHQLAVAHMANRRSAVASTKDRSQVRGGGKKPWRQKGTGRARAGSIRSPLWRGGGVTFGPSPERNFSKKISKRARQVGVSAILSERLANKKLWVLDKLELESGKAKDFFALKNRLFESLGLKNERSAIVISKKDESLIRAARNLPDVKILAADSLNPIDLLKAGNLFILREALPILQKNYIK